MLGVDAHRTQDFIGLGSQDFQSILNGFGQFDKLIEVAVVSGFGFDFLPQVFNRVVIWRIGW